MKNICLIIVLLLILGDGFLLLKSNKCKNVPIKQAQDAYETEKLVYSLDRDNIINRLQLPSGSLSDWVDRATLDEEGQATAFSLCINTLLTLDAIEQVESTETP